MAFLQGRHSGRPAEPAATRQQEASRPGRPKRKAVGTETPAQRYNKNLTPWLSSFSKCNDARVSLTGKNTCQNMSGDVANHASTSRAPGPDMEAEADMGQAPDNPPTEDADRLSSTNSEVESAMGHRRRRVVLRNPGFTKEAFDGFISANAYIRAARDGLTRAADQHLKDMRVSLYYTNLIVIYQ